MDKYPRTMHLPFSPEVHSDDKVIQHEYLSNFIDVPVIITEKLDGSNACLKGKIGVFARSHRTQADLPWFTHLKNTYYSIQHLMDDNEYIFGENTFAVHSIEYTDLDDYFYVFSIKHNTTFVSWDKVVTRSIELGLSTVPTLFEGTFTSVDQIEKWMNNNINKPSTLGGDCEGFVLRIRDKFNQTEFSKSVVKYVRKGHVQTDEHWTKHWKQAKISS